MGGQKPLKLSEFLLLKKKNFASFASKLKILSHKNAIKALRMCYFRFGGQKPLELSGFLLLKKKKFAYFASKLKILSHKTAIKALFPVWGEKSLKFSGFFFLKKKKKKKKK